MLFAKDCLLDATTLLVIYELVAVVLLGEAFHEVALMLRDPFGQVTCDARVKDSIVLVGQDINVTVPFHGATLADGPVICKGIRGALETTQQNADAC